MLDYFLIVVNTVFGFLVVFESSHKDSQWEIYLAYISTKINLLIHISVAGVGNTNELTARII